MNFIHKLNLILLFRIPQRNPKSFGQHSFSFITPFVWNLLPASLRNLPHCLNSKASWRLSCLDRTFHKRRQTFLQVQIVHLHVYNVHERCALVHHIFFCKRIVLYKNHQLLFNSTLTLSLLPEWTCWPHLTNFNLTWSRLHQLVCQQLLLELVHQQWLYIYII